LFFQLACNERMVIKFTPNTGIFYRELFEEFPTMQPVFIARHPKATIVSWSKMMDGDALRALYRYLLIDLV